jgi:PAS domain-containing protein
LQNATNIKLLSDARKDLTQTLQALRVSEAKSRVQAEQLRALSDELGTILNTAGIGITRCSRDLRYLRANEMYAAIAGLPLALIIGRSIIEVMGEAAFNVIRPYIERVRRPRLFSFGRRGVLNMSSVRTTSLSG